jgi:hypothetical protein
MKILVLIQDINNPLTYSLHSIVITKDKEGRILKVLNDKNLEGITAKTLNMEIAKFIKSIEEKELDLFITPIPHFLKTFAIESVYHPRIGTGSKQNQGDNEGMKVFKEGLAISYYIELLPFIDARGSYDTDFSAALFVDDGAKENTYRINHYEIQPLTLALIQAIYYAYKKEVKGLLKEWELINEEVEEDNNLNIWENSYLFL